MSKSETNLESSTVDNDSNGIIGLTMVKSAVPKNRLVKNFSIKKINSKILFILFYLNAS